MKVTTEIAISNLKKNKSRSILIGIAILLTTVLLTIIALSGNGVIESNKTHAKQNYGDYNGAFARVSEKQLSEIEKNAEFKDIGKIESFAFVQSDNMTVTMAYMDEAAIKATNLKLNEGKMPLRENEIAAPKEFFQKLGYKNTTLGQSVKIPYRVDGKGKIIEKEFIISGFYPADKMSNLKSMYRTIISEEFYKETIPENSRSYTVCFKTPGEDTLNYDQMIEKINTLGTKVGIEKKNIGPNKGYLMWATNPGTEVLVTCVVIGLLIILFSVLVIYNIFYVGIIQKVQEYGKLKAIGATRKQMKSMILKEGMILSAISIPLGLVIGYISSEFFFNEVLIKKLMENAGEFERTPLFNLPILIIVAVISFITVYISLRKPMKIVSKVSPIEAMKYQEESKGKKERKGYEELSLFKLTISNLMRNKKRTITTILTMGLSCFMFVVVANIAGSMDPDYDARNRIEKGDFYISLQASANDETYPENNLNNIQKQNLMGEKFINSIKNIDGVEKVETRKSILVKNTTPNLSIEDEYRYETIEVLSREDFNARKRQLKKGELDYDKLTRENGIIYGWASFFDEYGYKLNEKVNLSLYDGDKIIPKDFTMQGAIGHTNGTFIITEDTFNKFKLKENMTKDIFITCEKGKEEGIEKELQDLTSGNNYYGMISYTESLKTANLQIDTMRIPTYAVLGILGVIGFMNMANTLITSIVTRKRELGILQAIGLSRKQLNKMLQIEGLIFTIGTLIVALVVGNPLGYLAFARLKKTGMMGLNEYHFPILELGVMVIVLLLLQGVLSFYMSKSLQKDSLVDRIKYEE